MTNQELMLEALKREAPRVALRKTDYPEEHTLFTKAIAAGEAELRREPDASLQLVANLLSEYGLQALDVVAAFKTQEPVAWMDKHGNIERGWDAMLNPNEFEPLYTRYES